MSSLLLEINNVTKVINKKTVLKDINLSLIEGKAYGFVGHNGSGKTMLLRLILGLIHSKPEVKFHKKDISFGAIIENPGFILGLSGFQNLKLLAGIRRKINDDRIIETLKMVGLDPKNKKTVKTYSLGMKQKLAIAQAIMEEPDVLVLDEPTNGLDADSVLKIRELIINQSKMGKTIILTSHNSQDIEILCDEYFELENGEIVGKSTNNKSKVPN
ncbi:ABC transporter ATP-binding protein [Peribacillus simplex]|uniref:ABC transporter ATP-binding protein n=1 Tax=Peribacillus TaxID=2675229 RepID=UPI003671EB14